MKKQVPNPLDLGLSINKWGDKPAERRGDVVSVFSAIIVIAFFMPLLLKAVLPTREMVLAQQPQSESSVISVSTVPEEKSSECPLPENLQGYEENWDKVLSYCSEITNASEQYEVDPKVIAAIILMESGGDASAISTSGAVGLMQIMPSDGYATTFACANGPCFSDRPKTVELLDPEFNINFGTKLLASYISNYGNLREGLFHYGPMDVGYEGYADVIISLAEKLSE